MVIKGIGTDIVEISRLEDNHARLATRILTAAELTEYQQSNHPVAFFAKRFAAKEAAVKALGTGIAQGISFQHIEIDHDELGKPLLQLTDKALERAQQLAATEFHLSLSDEKHYAQAFVILA